MSNLISIGQIIDQTIERYRTNFKELFGIALWVLVAFIPLSVASFLNPAEGVELPASREIFLWLFNGASVLAVTIVSLWVGISLILAIDQAEGGKKIDAHAVGKQAWKLFVPFALVSVLIGLILTCLALLSLPGLLLMVFGTLNSQDTLGTIGLLLFVLGAIASIIFMLKLSIELAFTQYSFLLNTKGKALSWTAMKTALRESRSLVRGRWWATFFRLALPNIIFSLVVFGVNYILSLGAGVLLAVNAGSLSETLIKAGAVFISLAVIAVNVLAMPLYSIATYKIYDSLTRSRGRG
ncbi:MAG: hypothetical protein NUV56_02350 [Candidatus Uhrbacteria bacterium]|nr:hypothetical protein [Candidatus Uhrbacteria bacterium]